MAQPRGVTGRVMSGSKSFPNNRARISGLEASLAFKSSLLAGSKCVAGAENSYLRPTLHTCQSSFTLTGWGGSCSAGEAAEKPLSSPRGGRLSKGNVVSCAAHLSSSRDPAFFLSSQVIKGSLKLRHTPQPGMWAPGRRMTAPCPHHSPAG